MTDRDAFVRAIAADVYDDTPRLAFADWLDEHGDPARAEFIRVQCELEPVRDRYEVPRAAELHARENKLLREHRDDWLAGVPAWPDYGHSVDLQLRRGFPDAVALTAAYFVEFGDVLRRRFPTIRRVTLFHLTGWGDRVAACPHLYGLPELELACWYPTEDAAAVAASPHLSRLGVLELWTGGDDQRELSERMARSAAWPNLRELRLLDPDPDGEDHTAPLVEVVNGAAGRDLGRGRAGFDPRYPLAPTVRDYFAGRLPDGRPAFAHDYAAAPAPIHLLVFTPDGTPTGEEHRFPLPDPLPHLDKDWAGYNAWIQQHLRTLIGFEPAFIRVKGFRFSDDSLSVYRGFSDDTDRIGEHDTGEADDDGRYVGYGWRIYWLMRNGEFILNNGNGCWCQKDGEVHST